MHEFKLNGLAIVIHENTIFQVEFTLGKREQQIRDEEYLSCVVRESYSEIEIGICCAHHDPHVPHHRREYTCRDQYATNNETILCEL